MTFRALIIGGSGLIGRRLFQALGPQLAKATYHTRPFPGGVYFDGTTARVTDLMDSRDPPFSHAFVLQGIANIDACARNPEATARTNVEALRTVIDDLDASGITPVFASSDAVFDGTRGMWSEADPVHPVLTYGAQKAAVERYLAQTGTPSIVARIAKVVSADPTEPGMVQEWMDKLESGEPIQCARDQVFSPVEADDVVEGLVALAARRCTGVFHLCGPEPITRWEFLCALVEEMKQYVEIEPQIKECSLRDLKFAEPRPLDASMSGDKLAAIVGHRFRSMSSVCRQAVERRYGGGSATRRGVIGSGFGVRA